MSKNLLIVFVKNPKLGKVKTRLAKTIGDKNALAIYNSLLLKTEKTIRKLKCEKAVFYSDTANYNDIWDDSIYQKHQQHGEDLGIRMLNAFKESFNKKYENIIIIGSDLYHLKTQHINIAFRALKKNDIVIGPAQDGGYYLLGMKCLYSPIFKNKTWGTSTVLKDTLKDLQNKRIYLLETLNDIDVYEDLKNIQELKNYCSK